MAVLPCLAELWQVMWSPVGLLTVLLLCIVAGLSVSVARDAQEHGRLKRARRGLCAECGYDLRASPCRCPECGAMKWQVCAACGCEAIGPGHTRCPQCNSAFPVLGAEDMGGAATQ